MDEYGNNYDIDIDNEDDHNEDIGTARSRATLTLS
jgi:hypothetical protein